MNRASVPAGAFVFVKTAMTQADQIWAAVVRENPFRWTDRIDLIARSGAKNQEGFAEKFARV